MGQPRRRRVRRRRKHLRNVVFTTMAVLAPPQLTRSHPAISSVSARLAPEARVSASIAPEVLASTPIELVVAIPPWRAYDSLIHEAAALYRVSPRLIHSVMQAESAFDPMAISRDGAMGLMQLMPEIAGAFGIEDPFDPRENIMGGTRLLRELLDSQHNNIPLVLAAYNAGPAAVMLYGGIPPFEETQGYVKKIITLLADARHFGGD